MNCGDMKKRQKMRIVRAELPASPLLIRGTVTQVQAKPKEEPQSHHGQITIPSVPSALDIQTL
jgi:hypothetical protein